MNRIVSPYPPVRLAPAPPPAAAKNAALPPVVTKAADPPPTPPAVVPPELLLQPHANHAPGASIWRKLGLGLTLAVSLTGVVVPIINDIRENVAVSAEVSAMQKRRINATVVPDRPLAHRPQPEVARGYDAATLAPNGQVLIMPQNRGFALVSTNSGRVITTVDDRNVRLLADSRLVTWKSDRDNPGGVMELRDGTSGQVLSTLPFVSFQDPSVAPAGARLAYLEYGNRDQKTSKLHILTADGNQLQERIVTLPDAGVRFQGWSADGTKLLLANEGYSYSNVPARILLVDANSGQVALDRTSPTLGILNLSGSGDLLSQGFSSTSRWDQSVRVTDMRSGKALWERRGFNKGVFAQSGERLAMVNQSEHEMTVEMVEARTGKTLWVAHAPAPYRDVSVTFTGDGHKLSLDSGGAVSVFDVTTGKPLWGHNGRYDGQMAWAPNGSKLAMQEYIGDPYRNDGKYAFSLLDGADGHVLAQQVGLNTESPTFSSDSRLLLAQSRRSYDDSTVEVIDVEHSPMASYSAQERAKATAAVDRMLGGTTSEEQRVALHRQLDALPPRLISAVAENGTRVRILKDDQPLTDLATMNVETTYADSARLRSNAERAFIDADKRYGDSIRDKQTDIDKAREAVRQKDAQDPRRSTAAAMLGDLRPVAGNWDASLFDEDVRRSAVNLWQLRQQRSVYAWTAMDAAPGRLEPFAAQRGAYNFNVDSKTLTDPTTLESMARSHGAKTPEEIKAFADVTLALNGQRLEQAQQQYLDMMHKMYPAALPTLAVEQRPFIPATVDMVVPSYYLQDGRAYSGQNYGAMQDWKKGSPAVLLRDGDGHITIVLNQKALAKDSTEATRAFSRAFDDRLRSRDPKFYRDFQARWQDVYWNSYRYNRRDDKPMSINPTEYFVDSFTSYTSDGGNQLRGQNAEAARLMRTAVETLAGTQ